MIAGVFIFMLLFMIFHNTHAHAIPAEPQLNITTENNVKATPPVKKPSDKSNYSKLSPKAAYDKGVEYTRKDSTTTYNIDKAVDYIQYSAATGYAEAQFKLGLMYFQGLGVQSNPAIGFYWIDKAAKNDYPEAQIYLAYMYKKGIGVAINIFKSNYWLRQARDNGIDLSLEALPLL